MVSNGDLRVHLEVEIFSCYTTANTLLVILYQTSLCPWVEAHRRIGGSRKEKTRETKLATGLRKTLKLDKGLMIKTWHRGVNGTQSRRNWPN
jgi:hypothetical protein